MAVKSRDRTGEKLDGYKLVKKIGEGSLGHVYLGVHQVLNRQLAFKISGDQFDDKFFSTEAENMRRLKHPRIIQPINCVLEGDEVWISMQYVEHSDGVNSAGGYVKKHEPLDIPTTVRMAKQTLQALAYAHEQGVIHRDIKPNNLLVDPKWNAYVTDFNLAKIQEGESDLNSMSSSGGGSSPFQSPEQLNGEKDLIDERTDVYSLALTMNYLLSGRISRANPREKNEAVPEGLGALIVRALNEDHAQRIPSAQSFLDELNELFPANADAVKGIYNRFMPKINTLLDKGGMLDIPEIIQLEVLRQGLYELLTYEGETTPDITLERRMNKKWESDRDQIRTAIHQQQEKGDLSGHRIRLHIWEQVDINAT